MTEHELAEILRDNPDLSVEGDESGLTSALRQGLHQGLHKGTRRIRFSEHDLQTAVIAECDRRSLLRVEYGLIFAIPNGQYRQGQRMEPGLRAGVPDLFLPVARHGYHGLFIELKCGDNKPTEPQTNWLRHLKAEGYLCHVLRDDPKEVIGMIEWYLEKK
jgi:hypothetical protein